MTTAPLALAGLGTHKPWSLLLGLACLPFAPVLVAPWVGYDVLTVRGAILLAEVAFVLAVTTPSRLVQAWQAAPAWGRAALAVWVAWMGVTSVTALHPGPAALRTAEWVGHIALAAAVWEAAQRPSTRPATLMRWGGGAVLALCIGATAWWCLQTIGGQGPSTYATPLAGARNVGIYALLGLTLWLGAKPETPKADWWALWIAGWAVLAWTGGRASLGAAVVLLVSWAVLARPRWVDLGRLVAIGGGGTLASLALPHDAGTGLANLIRRSATVGDGYASGRGDIWRHVMGAWSERPWFGLGGDGPAFALADHTYAHNTVVQALGEWGLVGAAAFGALLLGLTWRLVRRAWTRRSPALAALAAGWLAASANGLLDGVFYGAVSLAMLAMLVGLGEALGSDKKVSRAAPRTPLAAATVAVVLALVAGMAGWHLAASAARYAAGSPAPTSLQARVALSTSTSYRQTEILWWGKDWAREHPDAARRVARWGQRHSRTPWAFATLEGDLLAAAGDSARAQELWRQAGESLARSLPAALAAASRATSRASGEQVPAEPVAPAPRLSEATVPR